MNKQEYLDARIVSGSHLPTQVKDYCKHHKLRFEEFTNDGFVASQLVDVKAGMEYFPHNGKIISMPIKKIGSKRIYRAFTCYSDKDIVDSGRVFNYS